MEKIQRLTVKWLAARLIIAFFKIIKPVTIQNAFLLIIF